MALLRKPHGTEELESSSDGDENYSLGSSPTNFHTETEALLAAGTAISKNAARTTGQVVLLSDLLSVLQTLDSSRNREMIALTTALVALSHTVQKVSVQWIPAHCDIRGNEVAKQGGRKEQTVSYDEAKTIIEAHQHKRCLAQHP